MANDTGKDVQCNNQPVATIATASALATVWHSAASSEQEQWL